MEKKMMKQRGEEKFINYLGISKGNLLSAHPYQYNPNVTDGDPVEQCNPRNRNINCGNCFMNQPIKPIKCGDKINKYVNKPLYNDKTIGYSEQNKKPNKQHLLFIHEIILPNN